MTNRRFAVLLGTGETTVSRWVNGLVPGAEFRRRISAALDVPESELWPDLEETK